LLGHFRNGGRKSSSRRIALAIGAAPFRPSRGETMALLGSVSQFAKSVGKFNAAA